MGYGLSDFLTLSSVTALTARRPGCWAEELLSGGLSLLQDHDGRRAWFLWLIWGVGGGQQGGMSGRWKVS